MKMLGRLPFSFSASATIRSSTGAKRAVHEPAAHSASPLPCAIRSNVGSPFTMPTPVPILRYSSMGKIQQPRRLVEHAPNQPYLVAPGKLTVQKLPDFKMTSSKSPTLGARIERWPIAGSFTISRGAKTEAVTVVAEVSRGGHTGRGECVPYARYGETPEATLAALLAMQEPVGRGLDRQALQAAMPAGAARNALDCALLDLEAKTAGRRAWDLLGRPAPAACITAYTISLGTPEAMAAATAKAAHRPLLKIKLGGDGDGARIAAVRKLGPRIPNSSSMPTRPGHRTISSKTSPNAPSLASRWSSSRCRPARMRRWRGSAGRWRSAPTKACTIAASLDRTARALRRRQYQARQDRRPDRGAGDG